MKELEHTLPHEIMDKALEKFGNDFERLMKELEHGNKLCLLKSWIRLRDMDVLVNSLHSKCYISIQGEPCTRPRLRSVAFIKEVYNREKLQEMRENEEREMWKNEKKMMEK
ncbi:hypothetical protein Ddye_006100 [Dipteronia dyeriana]|uniref:Uncharacterized protein n=1 Tax=Dipteronia dyeriana TaxID=168575 RepID=A0AAD9XHY2_9ROSI|nr:hypothetical protein Ddye_006100 [Dipteronia dyeriana]